MSDHVKLGAWYVVECLRKIVSGEGVDFDFLECEAAGLVNSEGEVYPAGHALLAAAALWDALPEPSPTELHRYHTQADDVLEAQRREKEGSDAPD